MTENELTSFLFEEVSALNGALARVGHTIARGEGQTHARWQVLNAASAGDQSVSQLARRLGVTRQAVQRVTEDLARKRLVSYRDNPRHSRSRHVGLTPKGRLLVRRLKSRSRRFREHLARRTTKRDLVALRESVRNLTDAVLEAERRADIVAR
jgi:DNA-binding MarR family transcriptional regulator